MQVKVTGTNFVRDTKSMALLNVNVDEKNEYYNKVRQAQLQKQEINTVKEEVCNIKNDMMEIKQLLKKLLEGTNGTTTDI
jgi:hypothetical protein